MSSLLFGCKKAADYHDVVFFTGTEESSITRFALESPSSMALTITSTEKVTSDVVVDLQIKSELVESLNETTGKNYKMLPAGSYSLSSNSVSISAGKHVSDQVMLNILSTDDFEEGVNYCVPVSILSVKGGGLSILEPQKTIFVAINKTIITQAVDLKGSNYFTVPSFIKNADLAALSEITMECRVYVNSFQASNPYISSIIGIEEKFLLRFGDVSIEKDQLQLAGGEVTLPDGSKGKYQLATNEQFSVGKWYHIAAVYNGSTMSLFVDGKQATYTQASKGVVDFSWDYMGGFHIGFSERGRFLNGYVSEARVWGKALNSAQLQENLCYVDPTSDGLVAYWRFNGDEEGRVTDLTGHGHTAVANSGITYVQGVRCPN